MELILISKSKLKIMLDERDMLEYHITDDTDCAEPSARRAIRSILDRARDEIGFETEGSEIFIQLYTSRRGGCELFVSKSKIPSLPERASRLGNEKAPRESADDKACPRNAVEDKSAQKSAEESKKRGNQAKMAFSFPAINDLISVCRELKRRGTVYKSSAFTDGDGRAYLILYDVAGSLYQRLDKLTFILEFGDRESVSPLLSYISEWGKILCGESAIERLAEF